MNGTALTRRLRELEQQQQRKAAWDNLYVHYEFLVAPSCPPGKVVYIRAGTASSSRGEYLAPQIADFTDLYNMVDGFSFANAYWYRPLILCFDSGWVLYHDDPSMVPTYYTSQYDNVLGDEVATAQEAEAQIDAWMNGSLDWFYQRFPLWGIVLRNTGIVGANGELQPIDKINRGRSYLYRDCRARTMFCD